MKKAIGSAACAVIVAPDQLFAHAGHVHVSSFADPVGGWWAVPGLFVAGLLVQKGAGHSAAIGGAISGALLGVSAGTAYSTALWLAGIGLGLIAYLLNGRWIRAAAFFLLTGAFIGGLQSVGIVRPGDLVLLVIGVGAFTALGGLVSLLLSARATSKVPSEVSAPFGGGQYRSRRGSRS